MEKSFISKTLSIILIIILIGGICCLPFVPNLYDIFKDPSFEVFKNHTTIYKLAFFTCYIMCLAVVIILIRLFNVVYKKSPFRKEIENYLKILATMFIILFLIVIVKSVFIPTLLSFAVSLLCFLTSLSFYVLSQVIKAAIKYKNEVDYTV